MRTPMGASRCGPRSPRPRAPTTSSPRRRATAPALRGYSAASVTQAHTPSLGRESLSSPRASSTEGGPAGGALPPRTLLPEPGLLAGRWRVGGVPLILPNLDWPQPPPPHGSWAHSPHRSTASPCLPGSALPPARTAFLIHPSEADLPGCEANPAPSRAKLSPYPDQGL